MQRVQQHLTAWGTVAMLVLLGVAVWWGSTLAPADAQEESTPFFNITRPEEPANKVERPDGAVITINTLPPDKSISRPPQAAQQRGGGARAVPPRTPITPDYIDMVTGHFTSIFKLSDPDGNEVAAPEGTITRIERSVIPDEIDYPRLTENEKRDRWQVVADFHAYGTPFYDSDMIIGTKYRYQAQHFYPGSIVGTPREEASIYVRPADFLYVRPHSDGVEVFLRRDISSTAAQYATITRYDHVERNEGTGDVVANKELITGDYVDFVDRRATPGKTYFYVMNLYYQSSEESGYRESEYIVPPMAAHAGIPTVDQPLPVIANDDIGRERSVMSFAMRATTTAGPWAGSSKEINRTAPDGKRSAPPPNARFSLRQTQIL